MKRLMNRSLQIWMCVCAGALAIGSAGSTACAGKGPIVAYITAWSMLGLQRTIVWELPLMGMEFVAIKTLSGILMPLLAGLIASRIPIVPRSGEMRD